MIGIFLFVGFILLFALFIFFRKNLSHILKLLTLILSISLIYLYLSTQPNSFTGTYFLLILYPFLLIEAYSQKNPIKNKTLDFGLYILILLFISLGLFLMTNMNEITLNTTLTIILSILLSAILTITTYKLNKEGKFIK